MSTISNELIQTFSTQKLTKCNFSILAYAADHPPLFLLYRCIVKMLHRILSPRSMPCLPWSVWPVRSQRGMILSEKLSLNWGAHSSNRTRSLVMIAPAYATAHMSQILIEPEESAASPNRSSKRFRCVPLWFPIALLWEFNLIPADILYPQAWVCEKKIGQIGAYSLFLRKLGYLGISLSIFDSPSFEHRLFYFMCRSSGPAGHQLRGFYGLIPHKATNNLSVYPSPTLLPHSPPNPGPTKHLQRYQNVEERRGAKGGSCVWAMPGLRHRTTRLIQAVSSCIQQMDKKMIRKCWYRAMFFFLLIPKNCISH